MSSTYRFSADQARTIADQAGVTDVTLRNLVVDAITARDFPVVLYGPTVTGSKDRKVKIVFSPNGNESLQINDPRYPFPVNVVIPSKTVELDGALDVGGVAAQHADEDLLGHVRGRLAIAEPCQAEAVDARVVAPVDLGERHRVAIQSGGQQSTVVLAAREQRSRCKC